MERSPVMLLEALHEDTQFLDSELDSYRVGVLKTTLFKKLVQPSNKSSLHEEAIGDFLSRNESVFKTDFTPLVSSNCLSFWKHELHELFMSEKFQMFGCSVASAAHYGGVGPGSSVGSEYNDLYSKLFDGPLTTTSLFLYKTYVAQLSDTWAMAEFIRYHEHGVNVVEGSKLDSVPKDCEKNRVICIEPTLNMYFQLGVKVHLEALLRGKLGINLANQQEWNKYLAKHSSVDGSLATVDLKNASDSISVDLLRIVLPEPVFQLLMKIRSPKTWDGDKYTELNMISTMGNGFTFPLMTILFATLCKAIAVTRGIKLSKTNFGVFGDDIIIPVALYEELANYLHMAGFEVNLKKSFSTGFFRESCGGDFYHGHDVRGIYCKELLHEGHVYSLYNRLLNWSLLHDIPLIRSLTVVKSWAKFRPIPCHESFDGGNIVHESNILSLKRDRNGAVYYNIRTNRAATRSTRGCFNSYGMMKQVIYGGVKGQRIVARGSTSHVIKRVTPNWNYSLHAGIKRSRELALTSTLVLTNV